jgi:hypothetical protein
MSTPATIAAALRILARDIVCEDGVATLCLHEAANEIDRLAAQVERLRMTEEERDAIADCADAAEAYGNDDIAATLRALSDRHARETVGE